MALFSQLSVVNLATSCGCTQRDDARDVKLFTPSQTKLTLTLIHSVILQRLFYLAECFTGVTFYTVIQQDCMTHLIISERSFSRPKQEPRKLIPSKKLLTHLLRIIYQCEEWLTMSRNTWQLPLQDCSRAKLET